LETERVALENKQMQHYFWFRVNAKTSVYNIGYKSVSVKLDLLYRKNTSSK